MGRKPKLNEDIMARFAAEIEDGLPIQYCCDMFGITRSSYANWLEWGERDYEADVDSLYADFFVAIKKAYALFIKDSKRKIRKGEPGWQGAAWWLERTNSSFMPKQQILPDADGKVTVVIGGKPKEPGKPVGNERK